MKSPSKKESTFEKYIDLDEYKKRYEIDDALNVTELESYLNTYKPNGTIYLYKGKNPYSNQWTINPEDDFKDILSKRTVDNTSLFEYACEARVHKSEKEIEMIQ